MMELKEFSVGSLLAEGSFSKSYTVRRKSDKKKFLLKKIDVSSVLIKKAASQELAMQGLLEDSSLFTKLLGHFLAESGVFCLLFEYCKEKNLQLLLEKAKLKQEQIHDNFILKVIKGLSSSLAFLEEREIMHLNVKPSSVFLSADFDPKLGDFTYAHYAAMQPAIIAEISAYSPPECVLKQPSSYKSDVWSIGCIAYALHQLQPPFSGSSDEMARNICGRNIKAAVTREHCQEIFDFIGPMMATNSFYRPSYKEILQHSVLQKVAAGRTVQPFRSQEEIAKIISKITIQSSSTDSSEATQPTTAKLNPYFVTRPGNFPLPPRKVRFLNDGSKVVSYKWYEIESKDKIDSALATSKGCIKTEPLPFLNEVHNFKFHMKSKTEMSYTQRNGNYSKDDLEKAVAEKLATRKFTMKYLRKTGKENYVVKHTKL